MEEVVGILNGFVNFCVEFPHAARGWWRDLRIQL
jgi:hypothetical protein